MNYKYYMPTKVLTGTDCIVNHKEIFKTIGTKALIVTGRHSAKVNGSQGDVITALEAVGIEYIVFDQVMSNPTIACTYEGAKVAKENGVDFIIAIGGGSPIDAAKGMALLAAQEIAEEALFSGKYEQKVLPLVAVPTTAGTGSEVTQYSILTNDRLQTKTSIATELIFPKVAFVDAKYMEKLSVNITINTAIDALSHAVEGMLSVRASTISDALAEKSIAMIMDCFPMMLKGLETGSYEVFDLEMREVLLQASLIAGMVIAQTGTTAVHAMGYSLTYFKEIDHGRANGLLLGEYLRLVAKEEPDLVEKILKAMNLLSINTFIVKMDQLFGEKEDISLEEIKQFSQKAIKTGNIGNSLVKPTETDIANMYKLAFHK
jgi:alcohol dehydrogenase class IV